MSTLLWLYAYNMMKKEIRVHPIDRYCLTYIMLLAYGNVVKQVFYSERIKQINDYVWCGLATVWLVIMIIKWVTRKQQLGKK